MITLKFTTEKANRQFIIFPTVVVDYPENYSGKAEKTTIGLLFGWLNSTFDVSISWTRKAKNSTANGVLDEAKCD